MLPSMAETLGPLYSCKSGVIWRWCRNLTSKVSKLLFTSIVLAFGYTLVYFKKASTLPNKAMKLLSSCPEQLYVKELKFGELWIQKILHSKQVKYLLTYSMVQSPSWEANRFAASQEIPRISRNPKVHYCPHKRPPPVPILGQPSPVHIPSSWRSILILSTHLHLCLPSDLFSSGFPTKTLYNPLSAPIRATCQAHLILLDLSPAQYWVRSTNHLAPRYAISSIPPLPRPS